MSRRSLSHISRILARAVCGLSAVAMLSACEQKELCYDHNHTITLDVNFDWTAAPDADPSTMSLYLIPRDGGRAERYEFTRREGGTIRVGQGEYDAICLNSDTRNVILENIHSFNDFHLTTDPTTLGASLTALSVRAESIPRAEGTEDERVMLEPEQLWHGRLTGISLDRDIPTASITIPTDLATETYNVIVTGVENLKYTLGVSAALTGMAAGRFAASDAPSSERVTIPFDVSYSAATGEITGTVRAFGHCPADAGAHYLTLYVALADGSKWYYSYDVADQLHKADAEPASKVHTIRVDGLPIPKPITNGGGFHPTVDDWDPIEITIDM